MAGRLACAIVNLDEVCRFEYEKRRIDESQRLKLGKVEKVVETRIKGVKRSD